MPSAGGLSVNWGGGGGAFNFNKYLPKGPTTSPDVQRYYRGWRPPALGNFENTMQDALLGQYNQYRQSQIQDQQMASDSAMRSQVLSHMMGMQRDAFGATAGMSTNKQVERGLNYLEPAVENARQGTQTGGISDEEYEFGIADARQRAAAQGQAIQGAITSALAQRGITNPLAGAIAGMKSQFESGRAAGAARADYDKARQQGRISYSGMYGNLAGNQAETAMRPTQENAISALYQLTGMKPKKRKFNPEYL